RQTVPPRQRLPAPAGTTRRTRPNRRCCHTDQGGCRLITRRAATEVLRNSGHPLRLSAPSLPRLGVIAMPEKDNHWLLRIGSGAALLGAVLAGGGNLLPPHHPPH